MNPIEREMQSIHAHNAEENSIQDGESLGHEEYSDKSNELPSLIFCTAKDLMPAETQLSRLDLDRNFLRLASHHERKDSNGLFECRTVEEPGHGLVKHDSWCCFKIKQVQRAKNTEDARHRIAYGWQQPSIYVSWNTKDHIKFILCMDTPDDLRNSIQDAWNGRLVDASDPYRWHCFIGDLIADLYISSVWALRDYVRLDIELRRTPESISFARLSEIARHIIHSDETLEVAQSTLEGMQEAHQFFTDHILSNSGNLTEMSAGRTHLELSRLRRTIRATFLRSRSLSDRIHNEINLAYNLVNQRDSFLMKTIAIMTLIYLPGSYLASIFGMNFFDLSPSDGLILSDMFWLYWVLTVVMTVITVGTWMVWQGWGRDVTGVRELHEAQENMPHVGWKFPKRVRFQRRRAIVSTPDGLF